MAHRPLGLLDGGPLDGTEAVLGMLAGEPPDELRGSECPFGSYVLVAVARHEDGSVCGAAYAYREDESDRRCRCSRHGTHPACPQHAHGWTCGGGLR